MLRKCHLISVIALTLPKIWADIHPIITDLESKFLHKILNPETGHFSHPPFLKPVLPCTLKSAHQTQLLGPSGPQAQSRMEDLTPSQFM